MASLTTLPCKILTFLTELCLESYYDTFIEEGYDNIDFLADVQIEELLEIGMKRGHAKRVIRKINRELVSIPSTSTTTGETKSNSDQDRRAPSVDPEEEDIDNLPIAHEVVALGIVDNVGRSNAASSSSSFDFNSMKKEMQDQMEVEFNARLDERLSVMEQEHTARRTDDRAATKKEMERMEQEHIARMTDERAAIKKEMELESNKAVAVAVERIRREVATSTGETKEQCVLSESYIIARVEAAGNKTTLNYNNCVYYGQTEGGKGHGYGTCTYTSGAKYVGEWMNDKRHWYGIYTWANGDKNVGEYKNGKMHGYGTYTDANGDKYVGQMKDDNFHGQGTKTKTNGTIIHSGEWVNDKPKK
jgi:hypothetical protein